MKQENIIRIVDESGKIVIYCDADVALGVMHDFLLKLKGNIVERISVSQAEEQAVSDKLKSQEVEEIETEEVGE